MAAMLHEVLGVAVGVAVGVGMVLGRERARDCHAIGVRVRGRGGWSRGDHAARGRLHTLTLRFNPNLTSASLLAPFQPISALTCICIHQMDIVYLVITS